MNLGAIERRLGKVEVGKATDAEASAALKLIGQDAEFQAATDNHEEALADVWAKLNSPEGKAELSTRGYIEATEEEDRVVDLVWRVYQGAILRIAARTGIPAERLQAEAARQREGRG